MATFNATSTANRINPVIYSYSTKIELRTDRDTSARNKYEVLSAVNNLGVGVSSGNPFTILA